jgi:hypothetical protein
VLDFLLDDSDDGHSGGLLDLAEVLLLQNGWTDLAAGQTIYGRGIPNKPKYFLLHPLD